jgi:hypothetical protein
MTLESGIPTIIDSGITAPVAGTPFTLEPSPPGRDFSVVFQATGTLTTLAVDLQISLDGGTTYNTFSAGILTPAAPVKVITPMIAGGLYRMNYGTASGSITVRASKN